MKNKPLSNEKLFKTLVRNLVVLRNLVEDESALGAHRSTFDTADDRAKGLKGEGGVQKVAPILMRPSNKVLTKCKVQNKNILKYKKLKYN